MKMVMAIIRHERLQEVQDVLDECGVSGVTVTEVKGCGAQRGYTEKYRGAAVHISLRPRLKIEAVMRSEIVNTVVDKMAVAARTGEDLRRAGRGRGPDSHRRAWSRNRPARRTRDVGTLGMRGNPDGSLSSPGRFATGLLSLRYIDGT